MAQAAMALAPILIPAVERMSGKLWDLTERGVGYLSDKIFGPSKNQQQYVPDYSRYQQQQQMGDYAYQQALNASRSSGYSSQRPYIDSGYGNFGNQRQSSYFNEGILGGTISNPYRETLGATTSSGFSEFISQLKPVAYKWLADQAMNYIFPQASAPYLNTSSMYNNSGPSFGGKLQANEYTGYGSNMQERGYEYTPPSYSQRYNDRPGYGSQSYYSPQIQQSVARPQIDVPSRSTYMPQAPTRQTQERNMGIPIDPYSMGFNEPIYRGEAIKDYGGGFATPQKRRFIGEPQNMMSQQRGYDTGFDDY